MCTSNNLIRCAGTTLWNLMNHRVIPAHRTHVEESLHGMVRCYPGSLSESEATPFLSCEFGAGTLFCIKISAPFLNSPSGSSVDGLETLILIQFRSFHMYLTTISTWMNSIVWAGPWLEPRPMQDSWNCSTVTQSLHCYLEEKTMGRSLLILFCAILTCGEFMWVC